MQASMLWFGLLILVDGNQAPALSTITTAERDTFEAEKGRAGKDARRLVELGLWAEAKGLASERASLLKEAVTATPNDVAARGLLGQVAHAGAWRSPEEVRREIRADARRGFLMAEYDRYRDQLAQAEEAERAAEKAATTLAARLQRSGHAARDGKAAEPIEAKEAFKRQMAIENIRLGEWCEANRMRPEAKAQYTTATLLDPYSEEAWRHLGYVPHDGRWMNHEEIVAERKEAAAQHQADRHWGPLLASRKARLEREADRAEAERELGDLSDPRAVSSIIRIFATHKQKDQEEAVRLLGRIDTPASSKELAFLAVRSDFEPIRREAIVALKGREARDYAEPLVKMIRSRWTYRFVPVRGPGAGGMLEVESPRFHLTRTYDAPVAFTIGSHFRGYVGIDANGLPVVMNGHDLAKYQSHSRRSEAVLEADEARTAQMIAAAWFKAESSREQMISDVREVRSNNASAASHNPRVIPVLVGALDAPEELGDDEEAWISWYYEKIGYRYVSPPKVTLRQSFSQPAAPGFTSCFAADTPVRSIDGPRPIQLMRVGDQVLSQDVTTGGLSFQPILAVHHNPADQTLKITLGEGEPVVASRFHRFWIAGRGWKMARELEVGDVVRTLGGVARVQRVETGPSVPVFNLDVAGGRTFFVGGREALVHDNTLPARVAAPFDAKAELPGGDSTSP